MSTTTTLNAEMKLGISSLSMDRASSCSSTKEAVQPQAFGQSLQKSWAWSSSASIEKFCQLCFHLNGCHGGASLDFRDSVSLVSFGVIGQFLQQRVGLTLWRFHTVSPHDAGGPVEIEHHH